MLLLPFSEVMMQVALLGGLEDYLAIFIYLEPRHVHRSQFLARSKVVHEPWLLLQVRNILRPCNANVFVLDCGIRLLVFQLSV